MAEVTGIAWCDHTWNPWIGCTEVSPGCDNCYARALDKRHQYGGATHWGAGVSRYRTKSWGQPLLWNRKAAAAGKRATVFPSMCDPFDNEVPEEWRSALWELIEATPSLIWLLLTKRIGNAAKMLPDVPLVRAALSNVWIGASVVNQEEADRDIPKLLATPAALRFVSYEPALGPIEWRDAANDIGEPRFSYLERVDGTGPRIDWIIVGGESDQGKEKARPFDVDWAGFTVHQCKAAGVPVFVKQLGSAACTFEATGDFKTIDGKRQIKMVGTRIPLKDRAGADPAEWPEELRIQEFPA